jgi:hypothetical protein
MSNTRQLQTRKQKKKMKTTIVIINLLENRHILKLQWLLKKIAKYKAPPIKSVRRPRSIHSPSNKNGVRLTIESNQLLPHRLTAKARIQTIITTTAM